MSFKAFFLKNRTIILAVGIPVVVILIFLSLPIWSVPMQVKETYWDTETITENYTATETYTDMVPYQSSETHTETVINQAVTYGNWSQSFKVDNPDTTVTINITNSGVGYYSTPGNYSAGPYIIGDNYSPSYVPPYGSSYGPWSPWGPGYNGGWIAWPGYNASQQWATVTISYPAQATKYQPTTKTRDVVKYREVPTQVRKEHTVTQNVRISVWEMIFMPAASSL
jgi:hypothetical protein